MRDGHKPELASLHDAWDALCDRIRNLGHQAMTTAPTMEDRLDGLRFILRQIAYREEQFVEFPVGAPPEFFSPESPTRKVFADCPDTIYRQFSLTPGATYRLTGTRGRSPYISFTAYRAALVDRIVDDLHDGELRIDGDGRFELMIGGPPSVTDRLDTTDAAFVVVREYCHDRWGGEHATFEIEQLDPVPGHRRELDPSTLETALGLIGFGLTFTNEASERLSSELRVRPNRMNEAAAELVSEMAGTSHNHYQLCYVQLGEGEALELVLTPPPCRYWSVHLNNWWLESPEFRDGQSVCINDAQAERNANGSVTILVAPDDPGTKNWLNTAGRRETILLARYLLPEDQLAPITTRKVAL